MKRLLQKPYLFWVLGIFIFYMGLNVIISRFYETIRYISVYAGSLNWPALILSAILSIIIGFLVAVAAVYAYIIYLERRKIKSEGVLICAGTAGGLASGICAACVSFVPFILSMFGIAFSWAALPLKGIEIQLTSILLLAASLFLLTRK